MRRRVRLTAEGGMPSAAAGLECRFGFRSDTFRLRERRALSYRRTGNGALEKAACGGTRGKRGRRGAGSAWEMFQS